MTPGQILRREIMTVGIQNVTVEVALGSGLALESPSVQPSAPGLEDVIFARLEALYLSQEHRPSLEAVQAVVSAGIREALEIKAGAV